MALDRKKDERLFEKGDLLEFNTDVIEAEILREFEDHLGKGPYRVYALDMNGKHVDGVIVSGSNEVSIPPEYDTVEKVQAYFQMSERAYGKHVASGKPLIDGLLALPLSMFKRFERYTLRVGSHVGLNRAELSAKDLAMTLDTIGDTDTFVVQGFIDKGPQKGYVILSGSEPFVIPPGKPVGHYFTLSPRHIQRLADAGHTLPEGLTAVPPEAIFKPQ